MILTLQQLLDIMPRSGSRAPSFLDPINETMERFEINTPLRAVAFIAQVAHESNELKNVVENLNYSAIGLRSTFPKCFTEQEAIDYAHRPMKIANRVYAFRNGNGGESTGDGWRYRGRGLLQITGLFNYKRCGEALGLAITRWPEELEKPFNAALSAGWFWKWRRLNGCADAEDIVRTTQSICGGLASLDQRKGWYARAKAVLYP